MSRIRCDVCGHAPYEHDPDGLCMVCRRPEQADLGCAHFDRAPSDRIRVVGSVSLGAYSTPSQPKGEQ